MEEGRTEVSVHEDLKTNRMKTLVYNELDAAGVVIKGVPVLSGFGNLAEARSLLLSSYMLINKPPVSLQTSQVV